MNLIYPVVFTETEDDKSTVLVYIPDFDGSTEGYGINDAFSMAKDYIGNALYDKTDYPESNSLRNINIKDTPFFVEDKTFAALVELNIDEFRIMQKSKNVRRNITLPE